MKIVPIILTVSIVCGHLVSSLLSGYPYSEIVLGFEIGAIVSTWVTYGMMMRLFGAGGN